ncbi:MAG: SDR family NAD(P)-dependent oxidoreductase [Pseudomonadota bacterium]
MTHPAFTSDSVAVITGGGAGIGLAFAQRCATIGMAVAIVDARAEILDDAAEGLRAAGAKDVLTSNADVSDRAALVALEAEVAERFGGTDILLNNAGIGPGTDAFGAFETWEKLLSVNLWGVIHGTQAFGPRMAARGRPGAIINTGSKQGITTPPGNPAYNVSKAGVKAYTEALEHQLRNTEGNHVTAHLMIPGFVFSDLTRGDRTEKPAAAWTPEQTADFAIASMGQGDFYILCPDNDVPRALDEKRMAWAIGDIIENRPPLSRWHPDWAAAFEAYVKD